jgi:hypothetical protein
LSEAAAFCNSRPFGTLFAPDGSYVHEFEQDAGGVKAVVIASVVMVFEASTGVSVAIVDAIIRTILS